MPGDWDQPRHRAARVRRQAPPGAPSNGDGAAPGRRPPPQDQWGQQPTGRPRRQAGGSPSSRASRGRASHLPEQGRGPSRQGQRGAPPPARQGRGGQPGRSGRGAERDRSARNGTPRDRSGRQGAQATRSQRSLRDAPPGAGGRRRPPGDRGSRQHVDERSGRPRRSWRQRVLLGFGVLVVLLALLGAAGTFYLIRAIGNIDRSDVDVDQVAAGEPRNYLLVGSDVRTDGSVGGRRSDTIMVVRLDPQTKAASVLSFPRDLIVTIAGTGEEARINSAYSQGETADAGRQTLIDTIRQSFGIRIHNYIEIDFQGFQQLVDAIGGVNIWLPRAIKDTQSGLFVEQRGCVTLNGQQALAFARSRQLQYMEEDGTWSRPDPTADLGRIDRQQVFIRRAVAKAIDAAQSNPLRLRDIISIGTGSVTIDQDTDPLGLFEQFRDFDLNNLSTYALPTIGYEERATVDLDRARAEPILNVFRGLPPGEMSPGLVTIIALNSTQEDGLAADAAVAFQNIGFQIGEPSNIEEPHPRTTVYHLPGEETMAQRAARHITGGADVRVREDLDLATGEVAVVLGEDFTTIRMEPMDVEDLPAGTPGAGATSSTAATTTTTAPQSTTTTTAPPSSTASASDEFIIGDPPPGVDC